MNIESLGTATKMNTWADLIYLQQVEVAYLNECYPPIYLYLSNLIYLWLYSPCGP
jgi:hypothetical protein